MGRPRKNPEAVRVSSEDAPAVLDAVQAAVSAIAKDPLADLKAVLGKAIEADPEGTQKALADVLGVAQGAPRKIAERREKIEISKKELEISPPEPKEPEAGVVFASPHQGFRQVLKPSQKKFYGDGNVDIIPPIVAEFEQGQVRLTDPELIAAMRGKIKKQRERGGHAQVVELKDEIAEQVKAGRVVGALQSQTTTIHDTLADLVTP